MRLHGARRDSEQKENYRKTRGTLQRKVSQYPSFIPSFLCPFTLRPLDPYHLMETRGFSLRRKATQSGFDPSLPLTRDLSEQWLSHCTHRRGGLTAARKKRVPDWPTGAWPTTAKCKREAGQLPFGWAHLKLALIKTVTQIGKIQIFENTHQTEFHVCKIIYVL